MNFVSRYFRKCVFCVFVFLLVGCGYLPSAKVVKNILDDEVFVNVVMSKTDPKNTVSIKDAVRNGIVSRLGKTLTSENEAQTYIIASIKSLSFQGLTYDNFGYITSYRINLVLEFTTKLKDGTIFSVSTTGDHDFRISKLVKELRDTSSVISEKDRYDAIENASKQAFDEFISILAIKSFENK